MLPYNKGYPLLVSWEGQVVMLEQTVKRVRVRQEEDGSWAEGAGLGAVFNGADKESYHRQPNLFTDLSSSSKY